MNNNPQPAPPLNFDQQAFDQFVEFQKQQQPQVPQQEVLQQPTLEIVQQAQPVDDFCSPKENSIQQKTKKKPKAKKDVLGLKQQYKRRGKRVRQVSEIDLIKNPQLGLEEHRNSALINQISNMNLNKKKKAGPVKERSRFQPSRKITHDADIGKEIIRDTHPVSNRQSIMGLDLDRNMQMQSQLNVSMMGLTVNPDPVDEKWAAEEAKKKADPYYEIKIFENDVDQDIQCDVCLEFEYDDDDQIAICDLCNAAVHQTCYGGDISDKLPSGNWYCERCLNLTQNPSKRADEIKCFCCDEIQGMMKHIDNNIWAHVICVNWTPEIEFADLERSKIRGNINLERYKHTCRNCLKKNQGSTIQCDYKNCTYCAHVRCAVKQGMIFEWEKMEQLVNKNFVQGEYNMPIFCSKHRVIGSMAFRDGGQESLKPKRKTQTETQRKAVEEKIRKRKEGMTFNLNKLDKLKNIKDMAMDKFKPEKQMTRKQIQISKQIKKRQVKKTKVQKQLSIIRPIKQKKAAAPKQKTRIRYQMKPKMKSQPQIPVVQPNLIQNINKQINMARKSRLRSQPKPQNTKQVQNPQPNLPSTSFDMSQLSTDQMKQYFSLFQQVQTLPDYKQSMQNMFQMYNNSVPQPYVPQVQIQQQPAMVPAAPKRKRLSSEQGRQPLIGHSKRQRNRNQSPNNLLQQPNMWKMMMNFQNQGVATNQLIKNNK